MLLAINRDRLKQMVQDLPPTRRNIVLMHCADQLTWAEIGEVVGLTPDRVRAIYESIVKAFKRRLT
jgi:DNA-directed RNA polymerase specialized sigma24 family protein